ncbi:hypothetical protein JXB01_00380 [Candidatus Micrarchaeota archaeon]|nr:hypothetical protein [Candidatus Micrarchaeota archaeon]
MRFKTYNPKSKKKKPFRGFKRENIGEWKFTCSRFSDYAEQAVSVSFLGRLPVIMSGNSISEWVNNTASEINCGPVLVCAGHYMPNLEDFNHFGDGPSFMADMGFSVMNLLNLRNIHADFLLLINDVHMPQTLDQHRNIFREKLYEDYTFPEKLMKKIQLMRDTLPLFNLLYIGEKQLYNRFRLTFRRKNLAKFLEDKQDYQYTLPNGKTFLLTEESYSKCVGAVAQMFKEVYNSGYSTLVFVYPSCGHENIQLALEISRNAFAPSDPGSKDLNLFFIYVNKPCF